MAIIASLLVNVYSNVHPVSLLWASQLLKLSFCCVSHLSSLRNKPVTFFKLDSCWIVTPAAIFPTTLSSYLCLLKTSSPFGSRYFHLPDTAQHPLVHSSPPWMPSPHPHPILAAEARSLIFEVGHFSWPSYVTFKAQHGINLFSKIQSIDSFSKSAGDVLGGDHFGLAPKVSFPAWVVIVPCVGFVGVPHRCPHRNQSVSEKMPLSSLSGEIFPEKYFLRSIFWKVFLLRRVV